MDKLLDDWLKFILFHVHQKDMKWLTYNMVICLANIGFRYVQEHYGVLDWHVGYLH